jgi:hypothetical protein
MTLLIELEAFIHVFVPPPEHAIDQDGQLMSHGSDGFGCSEFAAEATELSAEVALAPEKGSRSRARREHVHPADEL